LRIKIFVDNDDNNKDEAVIKGTATMMMAASSPWRKGVVICPIEEDADADEEIVQINLKAAVQETVDHHQHSAADRTRTFK